MENKFNFNNNERLPISYFKDLQDDKALVFDGYDTLKDTLIMSNELIRNVKPNNKIMLEMAIKDTQL